MELRCLMSARSASTAFDLRCEVREKLIDFLQKEHPEALPRSRQIGFDGDEQSPESPRPKVAAHKRAGPRSS